MALVLFIFRHDARGFPDFSRQIKNLIVFCRVTVVSKTGWLAARKSICDKLGVLFPRNMRYFQDRTLGRNIPPGLCRLHGCQGDGVDNIIDQRTTGEVIHRAFEALEHWADANHVRAPLNCFVRGIAGV